MVGRLPLAEEELRLALQEAKPPAATLAIDACKNCLRFTLLFSVGSLLIDRGYQSIGIDRNFYAKKALDILKCQQSVEHLATNIHPNSLIVKTRIVNCVSPDKSRYTI